MASGMEQNNLLLTNQMGMSHVHLLQFHISIGIQKQKKFPPGAKCYKELKILKSYAVRGHILLILFIVIVTNRNKSILHLSSSLFHSNV